MFYIREDHFMKMYLNLRNRQRPLAVESGNRPSSEEESSWAKGDSGIQCCDHP